MPADPRRVKELFVAASELADPDARQAYLDCECANDPELRQRLDALLQAHDNPHAAVKEPLVADAPEFTGPYESRSQTPAETVGSVIAGKYKLLQEIGEGGMGSVFMADQNQPVKRRVAVKVVKSGMDSARVLARFEAERQALALMDHPNIARVLDAGATESGKPFFVMELVKGVPLTQFCDEHKLPMLERLNLFMQICSAVQHAHQKGIIHRDLKPTNILVESHDGLAIPKVIDFGLAKATTGMQLTEKTLFTALGTVAGTPNYMAQEQAAFNAVDVDTRADIYALGVILYELLTGTTPIERQTLKKAAFDEMLRIVREQEPPTPSSRLSSSDTKASVAIMRQMEPAKLGRFVRGDLDWIVMKSLSKERDRRYDSATAFSKDIERFLNHEPVVAGPPSTSYRLRKFAQRNRVQVIAASLVLLTLVVGVIGTSVGLIRADAARRSESRQREIAEDKQQEAEVAKGRAEKAEADTLADYRASANDAITQLIASKAELGPREKTYLENTLKRWQAFATRQGDDERSRAIRGEGHFRVAFIRDKLGRYEESLIEYRVALDIQKELVDQYSAVSEYQQDLARTQYYLGALFWKLGNFKDARVEFTAARDGRQKLVEQFPAVPLYQQDLATTCNSLGLVLANLGLRDEARAEYTFARDSQKKFVEQFPAVPEYKRDLAETSNNLALLLWELGLYGESRLEYEATKDIQKKLVERFPDVAVYQDGLARTHNNLGNLLASLGKPLEATPEYQIARDIREKLVERFPVVASYQQDLGYTHLSLALLFDGLGKSKEAMAEFQITIAIRKKLVEQFPTVPTYQADLARAKHNLGDWLLKLSKSKEARAEFTEARDSQRKLVQQFPIVPLYQEELSATCNSLGRALADLGMREEALAEYMTALDGQQKLVEQFPAVPEYQQGLAGTHNDLGLLFADLGKREESRAEYQSARDVREKLVKQFPSVPIYQIELGGGYCNYGVLIRNEAKPAESLHWFDLAVQILKSVRDKDSRDMMAKQFLRNSHMNRAKAYDRLGKPDEAIKDWDCAIELTPPEERPACRAGRAASQLKAGMVAEAVAEVAELTKNSNWPVSEWYNFACFYAVASRKITDKKQDFADRAMELLQKAVKAGYKDAAHMAKDADLDSLRDRADFKKLIANLEGKFPPKPAAAAQPKAEKP